MSLAHEWARGALRAPRVETISTFLSELAKCVGEGENGPFIASFQGDQIRLVHLPELFRACPITAVAWRLTGKQYDIGRPNEAAAAIGLPLEVVAQIVMAADRGPMPPPTVVPLGMLLPEFRSLTTTAVRKVRVALERALGL